MTVFGDGAFGSYLGLDALMTVLVPLKRDTREPDLPSHALEQKRGLMSQQDGHHLQAGKRTLPRNQIYPHPDLRLPGPQNCEKQISIFKPPNPCYFAIAT